MFSFATPSEILADRKLDCLYSHLNPPNDLCVFPKRDLSPTHSAPLLSSTRTSALTLAYTIYSPSFVDTHGDLTGGKSF
jgi:hypothetical protein